MSTWEAVLYCTQLDSANRSTIPHSLDGLGLRASVHKSWMSAMQETAVVLLFIDRSISLEINLTEDWNNQSIQCSSPEPRCPIILAHPHGRPCFKSLAQDSGLPDQFHLLASEIISVFWILSGISCHIGKESAASSNRSGLSDSSAEFSLFRHSSSKGWLAGRGHRTSPAGKLCTVGSM